MIVISSVTVIVTTAVFENLHLKDELPEGNSLVRCVRSDEVICGWMGVSWPYCVKTLRDKSETNSIVINDILKTKVADGTSK